jgi:hypothetical protein
MTYSAAAPVLASGRAPITWSPMSKPVTSSPSASTVPAMSMPGVCGNRIGMGPCMTPARMLPSTGLNDVAATRIRTSPTPGTGWSTSS